MPVDSRIVWEEAERKDGSVKVIGKLECTMCHNNFIREDFAVSKVKVWDVKEKISYELGQHHH